MSTMYSRSVAMLRQAKNAILSVSEDDAFLDVACFETQQAVEFLIKAILLEHKALAYSQACLSSP